MAAKWIDVVLQVSDPVCTGASVHPQVSILKALRASAGGAVLTTRERHGDQCSTIVAFARVEIAEHGSGPEKYERFASALDKRLVLAASWLDEREPDLYEQVRRTHRHTRLLVTSLIDQDQLDLDFPVQFVAACGRARLPISIITNE